MDRLLPAVATNLHEEVGPFGGNGPENTIFSEVSRLGVGPRPEYQQAVCFGRANNKHCLALAGGSGVVKGIVAAAGGLGVPWKRLLRAFCVERLFVLGFMVDFFSFGKKKRAWQINECGCCDRRCSS